MAVSCSYLGWLYIWDVSTGELKQHYQVLKQEMAQLMDCEVFPGAAKGEARLVTCGGEGEVLFYGGASWETLEQEWKYDKTNGGHTATTRGVSVCKSGTRVISCSKDKEIHVIDLELDGSGRVLGGHCARKLTGHTGLVDRCQLFDDDRKLLSASWDNHAKVWDVETGECLKTLVGNGNKLRGCATFRDKNGRQERAVAVGSGDTLCVWDLDLEDKKDFVPTTVQIPTEHKSTTWGLALEARPKFDAPLVITYSNDGTIKCWDLSHGQERECVGGRRALNPPPMCVAVVDPAFAHGQFSVLVGCTDEIKMCDLSSIHTNPSAGAIWEVRKT